MLLVVLSSAFVPAVNLAQQPAATASEADMIETIQRFLHQLGYDPGPVDGIMGEKTRIAIRAFQRDHNLRVDGEASMALVEALTQATLTQAKRSPEQEQERQPAQADLTTMSPNELYVRAVQFEAQGEIEQALRYYEYLMETYPDHELAVKAADRVTVLSTSMPQLPAISTGPTATISALKGTVLVNDQEQKEGIILIAGDIIEAQAGAEVTLTLSDGSVIQLGENTKIGIDVLLQFPETGARKSRLKLLYGRIRTFLSFEHQKEGSSFTMETPNARIDATFSEPDIEVSYNQEKVETVGIAHTVELMAKNLLTDEKVLVPVGSTVIITSTTMKVIAGTAAAGTIAAESMKTESTETEPISAETTAGKAAAGISKGTMIAIGVGAAAALGGGIALAASGGDDDNDDGIDWNNPFTGTFTEHVQLGTTYFDSETWTYRLTQQGTSVVGTFEGEVIGIAPCVCQNCIVPVTGTVNDLSVVLTTTDCKCLCTDCITPRGEWMSGVTFVGGSAIATLEENGRILRVEERDYIRQ